VDEYERLDKLNKLPADGLNNLAWQYFLNGRADALDFAERAYQLNPLNGEITDTLGWILLNLGETARAVDLLRKANIQVPGSPEVQYHLAAALVASGERQEAKGMITELLSSSDDFPSREKAEELMRNL
jgi:tetratricopeptide (TPR) repeat protein